MPFFENHFEDFIVSSLVVVIAVVFRFAIAKLIRGFNEKIHLQERRTNLVIKYFHYLINFLAILILIFIWGLKTNDIFIALSSLATIIGVAMVAQWSILSNVTAGIIMFFSFPIKIGDKIKIYDKDFMIVGIIIDIDAFHVTILTETNETLIYPNNMFFQKGISILEGDSKIEDVEDFTD
jgi:small-conductance mechanosensitive channel